MAMMTLRLTMICPFSKHMD